MRIGQVLLVAGALLVAPVKVSADAVRAKPGSTGLFRLAVTLDGRVAVTALVDTGATSVIVCSRTAKSLGLKLGERIVVATTNGRTFGRRALLTSIEIKHITIRNVPVTVMDTQDCGEIILGMSALRELRVTLDGDGLILLGPASPGP